MNQIERGTFVSLFNRNGYVLNFSTSSFDSFTMASTGMALCAVYGMSKGKSLIAFLNDDIFSDESKDRLLFDLLDYYESSSMYEYECGEFAETNSFCKIYKKCCELRNKYKDNDDVSPAVNALNDVSKEISSQYIDSQIKLVTDHINDNPTLAIGKSKELIETICKHILEHFNHAVGDAESLPKLVKETMKCMECTPDSINDSVKDSGVIKNILNNLASVANNIAELRNNYGDGHGKSPSYVGLQPRHAKLALGACSTIVTFLWETFKFKTK